MAKAEKKKEVKPRAENYEPKVSFNGTFEDIIGVSVKDAQKRIMNSNDFISVSEKIKPNKIGKRKAPKLILEKEYYVSFGNNRALKCTLKEIYKEGEKERVVVEINNSIKFNGIKTLFSDEIGDTPEDSVKNEVTL